MTARRPGPSAANSHRELRTVAQEADRLAISRGWLYGEIRAGRFPHIRLGHRVVLDPAETDDFLARRAVAVEDALARAEEDGML